MKIPCPDGCGLEMEIPLVHEIEKLKRDKAALLEAAKEMIEFLKTPKEITGSDLNKIQKIILSLSLALLNAEELS